MVCTKCGTALIEGADFCYRCGMSLRGKPSESSSGGGGSKVVLIVLGVVVGGFALIVFIGILAAIAIPKFANTKEKAYVAAMKSDLRNLATAQETYFGEANAYATPTSLLTMKDGRVIFRASTGIRFVSSGTAGTTNGWNAQVAREGTNRTCSIYVGAGGTGAFVASGQQEGEPACW